MHEQNLYESLFADSDENDYALERVNTMFQHLDFEEISKYFDISNYNNAFSTTNSNILSVFHINLQSMRANVDRMTALFHSIKHPPDILAISEHWLTESNKDSFNLNGYRSFHVIRSWGIHGGVSLFESLKRGGTPKNSH